MFEIFRVTFNYFQFLAINSPVFESLFFGDYAEKGRDEIEIKDVEYEVRFFVILNSINQFQEFMDLLYVIYPGSFDITGEYRYN